MEDLESMTKEMLAKSHVELNNPDFERLVMRKISRVSTKKAALKNLLLACLIILTLETIIILFVLFFPVSDLSPVLVDLPRHILPRLIGVGTWIVENQYFILPLVILLIIRKIVDSTFRYRSS